MNTNEAIDIFEDVSNPLDNVEELLSAQNWTFDRLDEDELTVEIAGKHCSYRLRFVWQDEFCALSFSCQYLISLAKENIETAKDSISSINNDLWVGHFDLQKNNTTPCFRHTSLFRGMVYASGADHMAELIEIALFECERHFPLFHLLTEHKQPDAHNMNLAIMDAMGES